MRFACALVICLTFACDPPPQAGKGGKCHGISDCKPGLACVVGKCSTDLSSIEGTVPEYEGEMPAAGGDAGPALDAAPAPPP